MNRLSFAIFFILTVFAAVLLVSTDAAAEAPMRYEIVELPALEAHPNCPANSNATAINERGDVVGVAESTWYDVACHHVSHAVIWRDGEIIDLGGIPPRDEWSHGKGINDNGDGVVGYADIDIPGGIMASPAYWNPTDGMINITDGHEYPTGWAWGINNAHQVAITYRNQAHYWDAVEGLRLIELDGAPEGSSSEAWEINNNGVIVGYARGADPLLHAFRYDSTTDTIEDLHDLTFRQSGAYGLNDNEDVAGFIEAFSWHIYPAVWPASGGRIDLPTQVFGPGYAYCQAEHINDLGDVVGTDVSGVWGEVAIPWAAFDVLGGNTERIKLVDLLSPTDSAQWDLRSGFEINNSRQITGTGLFNGKTRGFLMNPVLFEDGFESGTTDGWSVVQP